MTDTIKKLQEVREALAYAAGHKFGDGDITHWMQKSLATIDAVIAGMQQPALTTAQMEAFESLTAATRDYFNNYMKDEAASADNCTCGDEQHKRAVAVEDALIVAEKRLLGEG